MPAMMKGVFMAMVPDADPEKNRSVVETGILALTTVLVKDIDQAVEVAKKLADDGYSLIELCGGFGHIGTGRVAEAVKDKAKIGVVRFDIHAALGKSGDEMM